jgi:hypothetical protein
MIAMFGMIVLINMFVPQAWLSTFTIPIGKGISMQYAVPLLAGFLLVAWQK